MKQSDFLIATLNNPDFSGQDFKYYSDMTLDNTQLLSKDKYELFPYIQNNSAFKNENGSFNKEKFNIAYNDASQKFKDFSTQNIEDDYEWSMWDVNRPKNGKIKNPNFTLETITDPDHTGISIGEFNQITPSTKSKRELAQNSLIYDPSTGTYSDKSLNEMSLFESPIEYFKSLFEEPVVYATYDHDEAYIDPKTGEQKVHKAGEWKVNEFGEYYTERLNGRSLIGKEVVSAADYLTSENSAFNDYDFMDSDDRDKSVVGTVAKAAALVAPMLLGGYVGPVYLGLMVAKELTKTFPMLYGMVKGLSGSEDINSPLLNTIAAYGNKFSTSTSDYSKENTLTFENIGNLMSDVALQWGLQKAIASAFSKLSGGGKLVMTSAYLKAEAEYMTRAQKALQDAMEGKLDPRDMAKLIGTSDIVNLHKDMLLTGKWAETAFGKAAINKFIPAAEKLAESKMKMGQDLSLVYMAMISNTDVYDSVLEHGGTPFEAAAIALGSTIGMFSVDKYLGLGEMFFNDEPSRKAIREAARNSANDLKKAMHISEQAAKSKKGIIDNIKRGIQVGKLAVIDYLGAIKDRTLGFVGKSLGEGLEEVSEELVSDLSKYMGEIAGNLGVFSQTDYGAWNDMLPRYGMSLLGGSLGGGLFYGVDILQNRNTSEINSNLIYQLRQGKKQEIIDELTRLKNKGQIASTSLSLNKTKLEDGTEVYLTAENDDDSQNTLIYNLLVKNINDMDMILNENLMNLSEDEIFDKMVLGEYRTNALTDLIGDADGRGTSYITRYLEDFQKLAEKIVQKDQELDAFLNLTPDDKKKYKNLEYEEKLAKLKLDKEELLKQRDDLFGKGSVEYVEKMLFAMDTNLSGNFTTMTEALCARAMFGKSLSDLTNTEKEKLAEAWEAHKKSVKDDLDTAFKLFKQMQGQLSPSIQELSGIDFTKELEQLQIAIKENPSGKFANFDTKLETDSDEEYETRNKRQENETEELFEQRKKDRLEKIKEYNNLKFTEWVESFSKLKVDRSSNREVRALIGRLKNEMLRTLTSGIAIMDPLGLNESYNFNLLTQEPPEALDNALRNTAVNPELTEKVQNTLLANLGLDSATIIQKIREVVEKYVRDKIDLKYKLTEDFHYGNDVRDRVGEIDILSNYHVYKALQMWVQEQINEGNTEVTLDDAIEEFFGDDEGTELLQAQIRNYISKVEQGTNTNEDDLLFIEVNYEFYDYKAKEIMDLIFPKMEKEIQEFIPKIYEDKTIRQLNALDKQKFIESPILNVLELIQTKTRKNNIKLGDFISDIYSNFLNGEAGKDFVLTEDLTGILDLLVEDLKMAQAFIHAASVESGYGNPIGHNKSINEYYKRHSDVLGEHKALPEIEKTNAQILILEAVLLSKELRTWKKRSELNRGDKMKLYTKSGEALINTQLKFFNISREKFKISFDLLKGFETIDLSNPMLALVQVLQLLHNNFIESGKNVKEVLDELLDGDLLSVKDLQLQKSSYLDENLTYASYTDYDKFNLIVSCFALSSKGFFKNLKTFIEENNGIAPLAIQEEVSKISQAADYDTDITNAALEWINDHSITKLPILKNASITIGAGGAGKSKVIAKFSCGEGEDVWVSGPTQSQIDNMISNGSAPPLPKAKGMSIDELLKMAIGDDAEEFRKDALGYNKKSKFFDIITGLDSRKGFKLKSDLHIQEIKNPPKYIVIDEATWIDSATLLAISEFCVKNGIKLKLLGDTTQNGIKIKNQGEININHEVMLAWRTPKLFVSLRDGNIQKTRNLNPIALLIDNLVLVGSVESAMAKAAKDVSENLPELHYYNDETIAGEMIVKELDSEIISKLKGINGKTIAVISDDPDSAVLKLLQDAGVNVIGPITTLKVQGQEFDFVIVDKKFELKLTDNWFHNGVDMVEFFKDLYTMITRSREGTILIDSEGSLGKMVKNIEDPTTSRTSDIEQAVSYFRPKRLKEIEEILRVLDAMPDPVPPSPSPGPSPGPGPSPEPGPTVPITGPETPPAPPITIEPEEPITPLLDTMSIGARAYSEFHFSGIKLPRDAEGNIDRNAPWKNSENTNRDLGILLRGNDTVTTPTEKDLLVLNLLKLKALFNFGIKYYDKLDISIRERFSKKAFEDAEYYVRVEDETAEEASLVGLTKLRNDKKGINGKVISIVARIKEGIDADGDTYELTLGTIANPETWRNDDSAIKAINKKIESANKLEEIYNKYIKNKSTLTDSVKAEIIKEVKDLKGIGDLVNSETWSLPMNEIQDRILIVLNNREILNKYLEELPSNIEIYSLQVKKLLEKGNGIYHLKEKPVFTGLPRIYNLGEYIRMEDINSDYSSYYKKSHYVVTSPVYTPMEEIPGLPKSVVGHPIVFATTNPFLNPKDLHDIYLDLKTDPDRIPEVRILMLEHAGVSFNSLFNQKYKDIYTLVKNGATLITPTEIVPAGARMYIAAWNYRADLRTFMSLYDEFLENSKLSDDYIEDVLKKENEEYQRILLEEKRSVEEQLKSEGRSESEIKKILTTIRLDEKTFRSKCNPTLAEKLKPIWEFNDSLAETVRNFRIGYSSRHGAYIRKLTNITSNKLHDDPEKAMGIYINPRVAREQLGVVNALFTELLDKIIPTLPTVNPRSFMNDQMAQDWVDTLTIKGKLKYDLYDDDGHESQIIVDTDAKNAFQIVFRALVQFGKYQSMYKYNVDDWHEPDLDGLTGFDRHSIEVNGEKINYLNIILELIGNVPVLTLLKGTYQGDIVGIVDREFEDENGNKTIGYVDMRIDDMFSLMFHGLVGLNKENDFDGSEPRANMKFKHGIFADTFIKRTEKYIPEPFREVSTNLKLYKINAILQSPNFEFSLELDDGSTPTPTPKPGPTGPTGPTGPAAPETKASTQKDKLKTFVLSLNINGLEGLIDSCINEVEALDAINSKLKDRIETELKTGILNFENIILSISLIGDEFLANTLQSTIPELKNAGKILYKQDDEGNIVLQTENGDRYSLALKKDGYHAIPEKGQSEDGKTPEEFRLHILSVINWENENVKEAMKNKPELKDDISDLLKEIIDKVDFMLKDAGNKLANKDINDIITMILSGLKDYRDPADEIWDKLIVKLTEDLSHLQSNVEHNACHI